MFSACFSCSFVMIKNPKSNNDGTNLVNEGKNILQNCFEVFFGNSMVTRGKMTNDCKLGQFTAKNKE